jgi:hypothetical protein
MEDYRSVFGKDYEKAISFLEKEKWIDSVICVYGLNPNEVKAIIFPELIRYNSIQDKIETFALETLYVQYGKAYANFSIGTFQIKPSFAENIEIDVLNTRGNKKTLNEFQINSKDTIQSEANRSNRVRKLKNKIHLVHYLCAFFKIMETNYPIFKNDEGKIKFLASAYNCGYRKSKEEIDGYQKKKFFQTGFGQRAKYNYSEIAWFYYSHAKNYNR